MYFLLKKTLDKINEVAHKEFGDVYLVGGFVRDALAGRECKDVDLICKNGKSFAQRLSEVFDGSLVTLDKSNEVYRVVDKNNKITIDISSFTSDTIEADLTNRDFTVNAMAISVTDYLKSEVWQDNIIDIVEGKKHIREKKIVAISDKNIDADPIRLLRGIRLAAVLDFNLDKGFERKAQKDHKMIQACSKERVADELWQMLSSENAEKGLMLLDSLGVIDSLFPKIQHLRDTEQNYHHVENVYNHSLRVFSHLNKVIHYHEFPKNIEEQVFGYLHKNFKRGYPLYTTLKLAGFFHDIGKPYCKEIKDDGRITFYSHHKLGNFVIKDYLRFITISNEEKYLLKLLVNYHMYPLQMYNNGKVSEKGLRRFVHKVGIHSIGILLLALADVSATYEARGDKCPKDQHDFIYELLGKTIEVNNKLNRLPKLITGDEIMELLDIPQSEDVGMVLRKIKLQQIDGTIKNKKQAVAAVHQMRHTLKE
ncbi:hypothetical protein PRVXT_001906 [Proteinivorax tanatarense]|uniref:HD/PDEase domain-containing protein n=1 Tax=Proteinivorax tanatarense TaxID=1260629 RepID=A0AAU7VIM0_9FIRM